MKHEEDSDSIRCVSIQMLTETSRRMVGHTPTEQLSGNLFQKLAHVIIFLDFVFSTTCSLHNFFFKGKLHAYRESYMSDLGPARTIVLLAATYLLSSLK